MASPAEQLPSFGSPAYWDNEYENPEERRYDWLMEFAHCEHVVRREIEGRRREVLRDADPVAAAASPGDRCGNDLLLLHIGSGNSEFPEIFREKMGCTNQVVTDVSDVCMARMQAQWVDPEAEEGAAKKGADPSEMVYMAADASDLRTVAGELGARARAALKATAPAQPSTVDDTDAEAAPDASGLVDVAFEKSTLDALLCHDEASGLIILTLCKEVHRVLDQHGGRFIVISLHRPRQLECYFLLPCFEWELTVESIEEVREERPAPAETARPRRRNFHYVYTMRRNGRPLNEAMWAEVLARVEAEPDADPKRKWLVEWGRVEADTPVGPA